MVLACRNAKFCCKMKDFRGNTSRRGLTLCFYRFKKIIAKSTFKSFIRVAEFSSITAAGHFHAKIFMAFWGF